MPHNPHYLYCEFHICNKRLKEFCFICKEDGRYYCDEICAERNLKEKEKARASWH